MLEVSLLHLETTNYSHRLEETVNQLLFHKSLPSQFVTLFLFHLTPPGAGQFVSAGHDPAYVFRSATGKIEELRAEALILGAFDSVSYDTRPFQLCPGDMLVVHSDGLTDADKDSGEKFGTERLLEVIRPQRDGITFLVVEKY